jgi:ribosomal-protein-alanine N-acetyltransferase
VHFDVGKARLRKPEPSDVDALFSQKNDPEIAAMLGGFTKGYTRSDLTRWVEAHAQAKDEALYVIADANDRCLGHVGLYKIDHRVRSAEFAILLGDKKAWGGGIGRACTSFMLRFGFEDLQLHRIYLEVLESNERAKKLYESLGFQHEGRLRHAQWKGGRYLDVHVMGILEDEWRSHAR